MINLLLYFLTVTILDPYSAACGLFCDSSTFKTQWKNISVTTHITSKTKRKHERKHGLI